MLPLYFASEQVYPLVLSGLHLSVTFPYLHLLIFSEVNISTRKQISVQNYA